MSHNVKPLGFQCGVFSSFEPFYAILGADVVLWALWCSGATAQCDFKTLHVYFSVRTEINLCQLCNSSIHFPHVNAKAAKFGGIQIHGDLSRNFVFQCDPSHVAGNCSTHVRSSTSKAHTIKASITTSFCLETLCPCQGKAVVREVKDRE